MLVDVVMVVGHWLGAFVLEKLIKIVELRVDVRLSTRWFYFHEERILIVVVLSYVFLGNIG